MSHPSLAEAAQQTASATLVPGRHPVLPPLWPSLVAEGIGALVYRWLPSRSQSPVPSAVRPSGADAPARQEKPHA